MPSASRPFHRGLDRATVVRAALVVADRDGASALTMRRVAAELEVEAASLYAHVRNKDDMVAGLLDLVLDAIEIPAPGPTTRDWLLAGLTAYRRTLLDHPGAFALMTSRATMSPAQFRLVDALIGVLEEAGLSTTDAVLGEVTLVAYVLGFVTQELRRSPAIGPDTLRPYPALQRAVPALVTTPVDDRFTRGIDTILRGLGIAT
ncbi:MAG TPA: TetR/AcrR family transcriptional regulator C-terminal domain-containing protein [Phycicoccus sp.]|nr:TetR/AcrR family transcriptional regulator C-terminal domain-containing protein [Phycicoccus sp.]